MKSRCDNPRKKDYKYYGGRGIKYCKEWGKFKNFFRDMGVAPTTDHTIDRIDTNGNYSPKNCKWSTYEEQRNNCRSNIVLKHPDGRVMTLARWARKLSIKKNTLYTRKNLGWSDEKILLTKIRKHKKH